MSYKAPCDRPDASPFDRRGTGAYNINAGIDSSIHSNPAHRGTLTSPELELIHQSTSYQQAMKQSSKPNEKVQLKHPESIHGQN